MSSLYALLQTLAQLLISPAVPQLELNNPLNWKFENNWEQKSDGSYIFTASSTEASKLCEKNPESFLQSPTSIQSVQSLYIDGKLLEQSGDPSFTKAGRMYGSLTIPCKLLLASSEITWSLTTMTGSLAHANKLPRLVKSPSIVRLTEDVAIGIVSGSLLVVALIILALFAGKVPSHIIANVTLSSFFYSISFITWVPDFFDITTNALNTVRFGDTSLWLGTFFLLRTFQLMGLSHKLVYRGANTFLGLGILIILISRTFDEIQLGDSFAFLGATLIIFDLLVSVIKTTFRTPELQRLHLLKILVALAYALTASNDILFYLGILGSQPVYPIGVLASIILTCLYVNEAIADTYRERDYLRHNLEKEVETKTADLKVKSNLLEKALDDLKHAQAESVQSAKLASLGTLSAGIAHEINNALNYVNGSLMPLQKVIDSEPLSDAGKKKATTLLGLMKEGLTLTFEIIKNLKKHTSTAAVEIESINLKEAIDGVLLLIRGKIPNNLIVDVEINSELTVRSSRVSFSQILMNLIINSVHAIEENSTPEKSIFIRAESSDGTTKVRVKDTGPGIPKHIQERVFDPFFTTKAVGKGTGLGLHIVNTEMRKQGGKVTFTTAEGKGTEFTLEFPKDETPIEPNTGEFKRVA